MGLAEQLEGVLDFVDATRWQAHQREGEFAGVRTYCMFVGYPRSGHSLIGSVLDAHPNMVVAHELDALRCLDAGFDRSSIFHLLVETSREFTASNREWNGYSYRVPDQWQGRYAELQVIGDKKGGASSQRLQHQPDLLDRLEAAVKVPIKYVHVVRNPYDNIATISRMHEVSLAEAVDGYFAMARSVEAVRRRAGDDAVFDLSHEAFIADPQPLLAALCRFLGQDATPDYLRACASIVFEEPRKTRATVEWPADLRADVAARMADAPLLRDYAF